MIVIVDYGLGNLGSVANMLKRRCGADARISSDAAEIARATALVLPGVGSFDNGMSNLHERGLVEVLDRRVRVEKTPILGICLGMQLFSRASEEGVMPGLGWIDAETKRLDAAKSRGLPIPHMGWNETSPRDAILFEGLDAPRFYYVHSYHLVCRSKDDVAATCTYGEAFTAAVHHENIYGTQFHPEKSHTFGMKLLQNFVRAAHG